MPNKKKPRGRDVSGVLPRLSAVRKVLGITVFLCLLLCALGFVLGLSAGQRVPLALRLSGLENLILGRPNYLRPGPDRDLGTVCIDSSGMKFISAEIGFDSTSAADGSCVFRVYMGVTPFGEHLVRGVFFRLRLFRESPPSSECLALYTDGALWSDIHDFAARSVIRYSQDYPGWGNADMTAEPLARMILAGENADVVFSRGPEFVFVPLTIALAVAGCAILRLSPKRVFHLSSGRAM